MELGVGDRLRVGQGALDFHRQGQAQLTVVEVRAFGDLLPRPPVLAQGDEGFHQDGGAVRVEGIPAQCQRGEFDGVGGSARGEGGQRPFVQQRLDAVVEPVPLVRQPGIKDGVIRKGEPLQQLAVNRPRVQAVAVGRADQLEGIAMPGRQECQPQRVAGDGDAGQGPAQLGQVPAQGAQRIRGVREQQHGGPGAADAVRLQGKVGQHSPGFAAFGLWGSGARGLDLWRTEEADPRLGHRSHFTPRGSLASRGIQPQGFTRLLTRRLPTLEPSNPLNP